MGDRFQSTVTRPTVFNEAVMIDIVNNRVLPAFREESIQIAEEMRIAIITRIENQQFDHAPLSYEYRRRKIKVKYDDRILIATRQYINAIKVVYTEWGAILGIDTGYHSPTLLSHRPVPMPLLARWLEYGTVRPSLNRGGPAVKQPWYMPPRPHWRPVIEEFIAKYGDTEQRFSDAMENAVHGALRAEQARHIPTEEKIGE